MNKKLVLSFVAVMFFAFAKAQLKPAKDAKELKSVIATAIPGDTIVMLDGEWKDTEIKFEASGTAAQPIVLKAQSLGKVKLTGNSTLRIGGDYLEVHGLWFDSGQVDDEHVIRFETGSDKPARYSRLSNTAITNVTTKHQDSTNYYVSLHGINNRVDHCAFMGKVNKGPTLAVRLKNSENNQHRIDHNYFGERRELGINGGETIRIGTSTYSKASSRTIVENNFFEKCNGEIEIISIKSANNIVRNNLFLESEGAITLRHGDYNLVEGNVIIGNDNPNVGGIRVINKGHVIQNNVMIGVKGTEYRAPLSVMMGIPDGPLNGYDPVVDVVIQNNTIINSSPIALAIGTRDNATVAPQGVVMANNLIYNTERALGIQTFDNISGIELKGNKMNDLTIADFKGVDISTFDMVPANNILIPSKESDEALTGVATSPKARIDATGALRSSIKVGAIVPGNFKAPLALSQEFGTSFVNINDLREQVIEPEPETITVEPGLKTLEKALKKLSGPATIILREGVYEMEKGFKITQDLVIKGTGKDKTFLKIASGAESAPQYYFRIESALTFDITGLTMDGNVGKESVKYAISSPSEGNGSIYKVKVNEVAFQNFIDENGAVFKAYKGTMADTISISNSVIKNSFRGLNLSYEKDGNGKYNANHIIISNSIFKDIEQYAVHFYREGSNSLGNGGNIKIDHSVFYNVDNNEKGRIIRVDGIENVLITNSVIDASPNTTNTIRLNGTKHIMVNSVINNSSKIKVSNGALTKGVDYKDPKWKDLESFTIEENSPLKGAATDGKDIGLIQ
ncbi:polysaccharide lyase 6 family protein [Nonlabens agnitus]|uniref:Alginate lyase n=1 Tax=Nonlabens agnitus TaxID=870484 RepID=A0A2S9WTA1_9FLAO|nr:polysaccharide lyase 6 family protein [Nonlabens agnitus]PRP66705.1 hypothetical protein BST86_06120 [Nonlabens agnitus]